ncbi:MAG TPA: pilus assembly protein PilP [Gammaproteobacteria bacterium]|nr:pilus assembly protein PilP [Gammaproteobacteria bacterium]
MMATDFAVPSRLLLAAVAAATLAGCSGGMNDLRAYIDEVKARPGGRIDPLPQIQPAPTFLYEPDNRRSPFVPDVPERAKSGSSSIQGPDPNRPREFLEQFPLDTMHMVGTLKVGSNTFGLIQTSDKLIHRVSVGNHLGQNYGRITTITESEIDLVEVVPDGLGGYLERPAAIALNK